LFTLPQMMQNPPTERELIVELLTFDATIKILRQELIFPLIEKKDVLMIIANASTEWQQALTDCIFELDEKKYQHLIEEPNFFFNLYISQTDFPDDGVDRLFEFFKRGMRDKIYALKLPLKELIGKNFVWVKNVLDEIREDITSETIYKHYYGQMIVYLHGYFPKEIEFYLGNFHLSNDEEERLFAEHCSDEIARAHKSQVKLELN